MRCQNRDRRAKEGKKKTGTRYQIESPKKNNKYETNLLFRLNWARNRIYRNVRTIVLLLSENHDTVHQSEQCVILTHTYILTWVVYGTTLTNQDVTSLSKLTTENLNTESLTC